jgi:hypothetical protein
MADREWFPRPQRPSKAPERTVSGATKKEVRGIHVISGGARGADAHPGCRSP